MTRRAALLAELARLASAQAAVLSELAALEGAPAANDEPRPSPSPVPSRPRRKRVVEPPAPPPISKDPKVVGLAEARAARALRRAGIPLAEE